MNTQLETILKTSLPQIVNPALRKESRKVWATAVRALLKSLNIKGVSITTPSYSMAATILIRLPNALDNPNSPEHLRLHDDLWYRGLPSSECPDCGQKQKSRRHLESIILSAFPDLDDRSDRLTDYYDYCLSFE